jgi:hypothetical protein
MPDAACFTWHSEQQSRKDKLNAQDTRLPNTKPRDGVYRYSRTRSPRISGRSGPFKGHADSVVTGVEATPDGLRLTVAATGQATHLGRFTRDESVVVHADATFEGTLFFTAANGDQLFADVEGAFISATTALGTYTFTGGTGRFKNASWGTGFVGVTSDGIHIAVKFAGTISSPGANQK